MKKYILILFCTVGFSALSQTADKLFENANSSYNNENYDLAISYYDSIIAQGLESKELYYNLANSWYLKGNIPLAILNYEKALKINPYHTFSIYNLEIAEKRINKLEQLPTLKISYWANKLIKIASLNLWSFIFLLSIWISCFFAYRFINYRSKFNFKIVIISGLICLFLYASFNTKKNQYNTKVAIVTNNTELFIEPNKQAKKILDLSSGNKIVILNQSENWIYVALPNGDKGWISDNTVSYI